MESSTSMEGTPTDSEIAARFERATRSGLASSSLASYSYSETSSTMDQRPTLADLLPHLGPPDAPRCPACRACLPFGPRSRICLACCARIVQTSPPSFTSTLAFRHFSESLHFDDMETDSGEAEAEFSLGPEVDMASKISSKLSPPVGIGGQKTSWHADITGEQEKPEIEPEIVKLDTQAHLPSSAGLDSMTPANPMDPISVEEKTHTSILDYSAKLEGISLDDFFSNQSKSQAPVSATTSDVLSDKRPISTESQGVNFLKDSLFYDPLSDSIIPDGFDLIANTSATTTNKVVLDNIVDGDDPFSSWECDFQSAAPAAAKVSATASSDAHGAPVSSDPITSQNIEDMFGDFPSTSGEETVGIQGNDSWRNGGDPFGLKTDTENTFYTDSQRSMDVDDVFGSGWQQSAPHVPESLPSESHSSTLIMQSGLLKSRQDEDLLGIHSSKEMEASTINHSVDSVGELTSRESSSTLGPASASDSGGKKSKLVGSLLAQLHDLSFLLADKLVMKAEGENSKPDFYG